MHATELCREHVNCHLLYLMARPPVPSLFNSKRIRLHHEQTWGLARKVDLSTMTVDNLSSPCLELLRSQRSGLVSNNTASTSQFSDFPSPDEGRQKLQTSAHEVSFDELQQTATAFDLCPLKDK